MISITADLHAHPFESWSRTLENGRNSRLQILVDCLRQISDRAGRDGLVIVAGDVFDDRKSVPVPAIDAIGEWLEYAASLNQKVLISLGNHDQYLRDQNCNSLRLLRNHNNVVLFEQPGSYKFKDFTFHLFPYVADPSQLSKQLDEWQVPKADNQVLLIHADLIGARMNGGMVAEKGIPSNHPAFDRYQHVISGHYHRPQHLGGNVHYVGSPYQLDRGEQGETKRFFHLDHNGLESVELEGVPEFRSVSFDQYQEIQQQGGSDDFISVICESSDQIERLGRDETVSPVLKAPEVQLEFKGSIDCKQAIEHYLDGVNRPDLLNLALSFLQP